MPRAAERARGVRYYRTIKPKARRYIHVAVVKKAGPRGGHTVAGPVHRTKAAKQKRGVRRRR